MKMQMEAPPLARGLEAALAGHSQCVPGGPALGLGPLAPALRNGPAPLTNNRILIVGGDPATTAIFRDVLGAGPQGADSGPGAEPFELHFAATGQEAVKLLRQSRAANQPFALGFVDGALAGGWDPLQTIAELWKIEPGLEVMLGTACLEFGWEELMERLGWPQNLVLLKQPFDPLEIRQLAYGFSRRWELARQAQLKFGELTRMVALRTSELLIANEDLRREMQERAETERQLRHAQKLEAVGQLAAGVAHDFNNILTVIHGHASMLLLRSGTDGPQGRSLTEIRHSAERAANLVRQLLTFSRKQVMQFRNVELGEVIRSVSGMLGQLVGEHIVLETDCPAGLPPIHADRGMIEQVIVNLTINARDAMPRGGHVRVKSSLLSVDESAAQLHPEARPGSFICLSVTDTGCGMDAATLGHLFEPFFTTKEVGKGTGLGLATVYGIVRQHKGWIQVQSQVQAGTTFQIFFPVSEQAVLRAPEAQTEAFSRRGTETILLAEDEGPLREIMADVLSLQGYRVLSAGTGPAALDLSRHEPKPIDLLLTDMVMPGGMMGTELAAELQRVNTRLKVIFTTGYSPGSSGLPESLPEGAFFLPKPYSPSKLAQMVRKCLDG